MVFAIEPMVNVGGPDVYMDDDGWSVYSEDGSMAAHFEYTVAATADGPRILTPWDKHDKLCYCSHSAKLGRFFTPGARLLGPSGDLFQKELKDDEGPSLGKTDV